MSQIAPPAARLYIEARYNNPSHQPGQLVDNSSQQQVLQACGCRADTPARFVDNSYHQQAVQVCESRLDTPALFEVHSYQQQAVQVRGSRVDNPQGGNNSFTNTGTVEMTYQAEQIITRAETPQLYIEPPPRSHSSCGQQQVPRPRGPLADDAWGGSTVVENEGTVVPSHQAEQIIFRGETEQMETQTPPRSRETISNNQRVSKVRGHRQQNSRRGGYFWPRGCSSHTSARTENHQSRT